MLLAMLVLLDSILQMQLFQINQSEDSSKITIMSDTTCVQLHHRPITSASNYNRITLGYDHEQDFIRNIMLVHVLVWPAELESSGGGAASDSWEIKWDGCKQFVRCEMQLRWASQSSAVWDAADVFILQLTDANWRCNHNTALGHLTHSDHRHQPPLHQFVRCIFSCARHQSCASCITVAV